MPFQCVAQLIPGTGSCSVTSTATALGSVETYNCLCLSTSNCYSLTGLYCNVNCMCLSNYYWNIALRLCGLLKINIFSEERVISLVNLNFFRNFKKLKDQLTAKLVLQPLLIPLFCWHVTRQVLAFVVDHFFGMEPIVVTFFKYLT